MPTPTHVLAAPVEEGGELVFAHALDSGIRVWMRGLTRLVDERPRRLRGVAAPLYGGTIRDLPPLRDFVADFVEHAVDDPALPLTPGRIRDTRPVVARAGLDAVSSRMHFSNCAMSPLHTVGPWNGAAAELLLSRVRGLDYRTSASSPRASPSSPPAPPLTPCPRPSSAASGPSTSPSTWRLRPGWSSSTWGAPRTGEPPARRGTRRKPRPPSTLPASPRSASTRTVNDSARRPGQARSFPSIRAAPGRNHS